jgi:hypothetical protein
MVFCNVSADREIQTIGRLTLLWSICYKSWVILNTTGGNNDSLCRIVSSELLHKTVYAFRVEASVNGNGSDTHRGTGCRFVSGIQ